MKPVTANRRCSKVKLAAHALGLADGLELVETNNGCQ